MHWSLYNGVHPIINCRAESATRELEEVQASRKDELERTVARMGGLKKELAKEKELKVGLTQVKVRLEEELRGLKVERQEK